MSGSDGGSTSLVRECCERLIAVQEYSSDLQSFAAHAVSLITSLRKLIARLTSSDAQCTRSDGSTMGRASSGAGSIRSASRIFDEATGECGIIAVAAVAYSTALHHFAAAQLYERAFMCGSVGVRPLPYWHSRAVWWPLDACRRSRGRVERHRTFWRSFILHRFAPRRYAMLIV